MMKTLMIAAALATATAGFAAAESTVVNQNKKLDQIFAQQRAATQPAQVSTDARGGFLERTFGSVRFGVIDPATAERGGSGRFGPGDRGR